MAVLQYTGGTTGVPKGAELTHANLYVNAVQIGRWLPGCEPGQERILGVLPLFHIFGMATVMNFGLLLGAELILLPRFELEQLMQTIHRKRPTIFPAVPTLFAAITRHEDRSRYDLSSIELCISGGAPLPAEVKDSFERLTGCVIVEGYGLTEASPVVACNPVGGARKTGSIGLPLPLTEVEIVSLDDGRTPVPQGERGELCVRGPQVMRGYLEAGRDRAGAGRRPSAHRRRRLPGRGRLRLHRRPDQGRDPAGGFNVYPRNVEEAIYLHPAVEECVVAGRAGRLSRPDGQGLDQAGARQALTRDELRAFLEDKLSQSRCRGWSSSATSRCPRPRSASSRARTCWPRRQQRRPRERRHDGSVVIAGYARSPFQPAHKGASPASGPTIWRRRWSPRWSSAPASTRRRSRT